MTRSRRVPAPRPLPPAAFVDRVMVAVRLEATPTPARAFGSALRTRSLHGAGSALAVAWHLATVRSWSVAPSVRARSMALVLAVTLALISASLAAAGAVRLATDPVNRLFEARVDDRGPLVPPPALLNSSGDVDPDVEDGAAPADRGADREEADAQDSDDQANENDGNEAQGPGAAASDDGTAADDDGADADDAAREDDGADSDGGSTSDADAAESDEAEPADDTDAAETDEAEPDQPDDAHDTDSEAGEHDGDTSDDSGSGSETDD
jgi:hypothetical protein